MAIVAALHSLLRRFADKLGPRLLFVGALAAGAAAAATLVPGTLSGNSRHGRAAPAPFSSVVLKDHGTASAGGAAGHVGAGGPGRRRGVATQSAAPVRAGYQ